MALKGNRADLSDEVTMLLEQTIEKVDSGHGRVETHCCCQIKINTKYLPSSERWPNLGSIIEIEATCIIDKKTSTEKPIISAHLD